ncbi:hypothetical protein ACPA0F_03255 [Solibacillus silvestris]
MIIIEWIFVILTTFISLISLRRIINSVSKSIADYVLTAIYLLNCFPVLLDLIYGIPNYQSLFSSFTIAQMKNEVRLVYDFYIFSIMLSLGLYAKYVHSKRKNYSLSLDNTRNTLIFKSICIFLILLPFLHVLFSPYSLNYILEYGSAGLRGIPPEFSELNALFGLLSIIFFCLLFFSRKGRKSDYLLLMLYSFSLVWVNGKRNIVLILAVFFLYYYNNSKWRENHKINLKLLTAVFIIFMLSFSTNYLINTRGSIENTWDEIYTASRIDFGRDDVTKYVINMETFEGNPIQEYRLQGLIGSVFMYFPRILWEEKPYQHYRYLTAKLVGGDPATIHFGMTPSIIEQAIADFGNFGYPICVLFLLLFCRYADKQKSTFRKAILLMLILGALSMSMDYLAVYIVIYFSLVLLGLLVKGTRNPHGQIK